MLLRALLMLCALVCAGPAFAALGCATEVHRSHCSCEIVEGPDSCRIEHEEHDFKKRPLGAKILDALGSLVGLVAP